MLMIYWCWPSRWLRKAHFLNNWDFQLAIKLRVRSECCMQMPKLYVGAEMRVAVYDSVIHGVRSERASWAFGGIAFLPELAAFKRRHCHLLGLVDLQTEGRQHVG